MIKSLTGRVAFGSGLVLLSAPVVVLLFFYIFNKQNERADLLGRSEQVLGQIAVLQQQAGTNTPGYRFALRDLKRMVADDRQQVNQLIELESLLDTPGQAGFIRKQLAELAAAERRETVRREAALSADIDRAKWGWLLAVFITLSNIGILIHVMLSEFTNRRRAEAELQTKLLQLKQYTLEDQERNWQLAGTAALTEQSLQGLDNLNALCASLLATLVQHLDVPAGALFILQDDTNTLALKAGIGLPADARTTYAPGEGLVGRISSSQQVVVINDVPAGYWNLTSATGETSPGQLIGIPLRLNKRLRGVIELASFRALEPGELNWLLSVSEPISIVLHAVESREKIARLLDELQVKNRTVEEQQERLQQSNEELSRQAEVLQASEEELKVQEEELRQINAELEEKNEAVEIARQALAAKARELELTSKYKSEFLANMSHELRTPLNSVLILAKLLADNKDGNLTAKQVEYATIVHRSGSDLLDLINDILDLAKIEAGKIDMHPEPVPVAELVQDMQLLFSVVAEEKGVQFIRTVDPAVPPTLTTDKVRLEQILKNLLANAFKFTPRAGSVTLAVEPAPPGTSFTSPALREAAGVLALRVSDTGIGISPDKQQLIFEAFQQADGSTSRRYGGTGLGLSISRELIRRLGGEIQLYSAENRGSTFTVFLPTTPIARTTAPVPDTNLHQAPVTLPTDVVEQTRLADDRHLIQPGDNVMLIIEDDPYFAGIIRDFAREKNYKTIVALQGDEGLYYARRYRPSAITLDRQLPVINGEGVLQFLKNDEQLRHIPVHIISAADATGFDQSDVVAYLRKPVLETDLERAFSLIGNQVSGSVKKILLLSGTYLNDQLLAELTRNRQLNLTYDVAHDEADALEKLRQQRYDCLIADIGQALTKGLDSLQTLRPALQQNQVPVIIYLDQDLSPADELQLKRVSDAIIRDSSLSKTRLMDELELFLYKVQQAAPKPAVEPVTPLPDRGFDGKKILLVDDDMRNVFALSTLLEEQHLTVVTASDGREALDMLAEHPDIDLVLMDTMMPEMDGSEATRQIRANPRVSSLPVIALTAKAMPGDREKSIEAGASDYITKPVDSNRLFSLLRVWLQ